MVEGFLHHRKQGFLTMVAAVAAVAAGQVSMVETMFLSWRGVHVGTATRVVTVVVVVGPSARYFSLAHGS